MAKDKTISAQYKLFAEHYVECFNAGESAVFAGYSKRSAKTQGSRMLKNVDLREYISQLVEEKSIGFEQRLILLGNIAIEGDKDSDRIKAIELLGKLNQDYIKKVEVDSNITMGVMLYLPENGRDNN